MKRTFKIFTALLAVAIIISALPLQSFAAETAPAVVSGFKSDSTTDTTITLSWNKVSGATGYVLYQYNFPAKKYERICKYRGITYTNYNLTAGTTYKYAIRAYKTVNGKDVLSKSYPQLSVTTNPATVTSITAALRTDKISISWKKAAGAKGYVLYRYDFNENKYTRLSKQTATSYTDSDIELGRSYKYAVRAYTTADKKEILSNKYPQVTINTNIASVTNISSKSYDNKIELSWGKAAGAHGYVVYKYDFNAKKYSRISKQTGNTYTDTNLESGEGYRYAVRAYAAIDGKEVLSKTYFDYNVATIPAIVEYDISIGKGQVRFDWEPVNGATGYKIYYKEKESDSWKGLKTTTDTSFEKTGLASGKCYFAIKAYKDYYGKIYSGRYIASSVTIK